MLPNSPGTTITVSSTERFIDLLKELTGLDADPTADVVEAVDRLLHTVGAAPARSADAVARDFYARMNDKMRLTGAAIASVHKRVAELKVSLNYHQKKRIALAVNRGERSALAAALELAGLGSDGARSVAESTRVLELQETQLAIMREASAPTKLRKLPDRAVGVDVQSSASGALVASLWSDEARYIAAGAGGEGDDATDYIAYLQARSPELFARTRALSVRYVDAAEAEAAGRSRSGFEPWLRDEYSTLANHGFLAVILEVPDEGKAWAWDALLDLTVVAERFVESEVKQMFFRWRDVERETLDQLGAEIDPRRAAFSTLNEGFTYRDTFVLTSGEGEIRRLAAIFQKNKRDETLIPCPACRSSKVEGNSYPSLGVKSWACANPICCERSIYNRGKRYQFKSILQQAAIEDPANQISVGNVRRWQRDVLRFEGDAEILRTVIAHYSMRGDGVHLVNFPTGIAIESEGREISAARVSVSHKTAKFWEASFFARYMTSDLTGPTPNTVGRDLSPMEGRELATTLLGDSTHVLRATDAGGVDIAITSPPYFNAREYAQWPNLYTYLHDMVANAREVLRVLKPGGFYAYNIFDYFDNERTVAFSDMGKKRIALASLIADGFRRIGFELAGVTVWDKGEIHGKRGFNGGNFSPFYQSPFNCWEHVLLFRKPSERNDDLSGDAGDVTARVLKLHPVVKMIRGENVLGHTAPFPLELPLHYLQHQAPGALVLDPYAGSGTTGIAALQSGMRTLLVERDPEYFSLVERRLAPTLAEVRLTQNVDDLSMV